MNLLLHVKEYAGRAGKTCNLIAASIMLHRGNMRRPNFEKSITDKIWRGFFPVDITLENCNSWKDDFSWNSRDFLSNWGALFTVFWNSDVFAIFRDLPKLSLLHV